MSGDFGAFMLRPFDYAYKFPWKPFTAKADY